MEEFTVSKEELAEIDKLTAEALAAYINGDTIDAKDLADRWKVADVPCKSTAKG
jgi:hypothetical protein